MKGVSNRILRINLKTKTSKEETTSDKLYESYLGGKGLGTFLLMKENPPGVDPLSPDNKLIFCIGPATDSRIYGSCRHGVFTKSPLTGIFSESCPSGKREMRTYAAKFTTTRVNLQKYRLFTGSPSISLGRTAKKDCFTKFYMIRFLQKCLKSLYFLQRPSD
ncbi:MAG: aldehyde ferredoxin oxidoreductase N-terminal domain-containing protein [Thermodesulfobacteriota bacterium]